MSSHFVEQTLDNIIQFLLRTLAGGQSLIEVDKGGTVRIVGCLTDFPHHHCRVAGVIQGPGHRIDKFQLPVDVVAQLLVDPDNNADLVVDGPHRPMLLNTDLHRFRDARIARIGGRQAVLPAGYSIIQGSMDKTG